MQQPCSRNSEEDESFPPFRHPTATWALGYEPATSPIPVGANSADPFPLNNGDELQSCSGSDMPEVTLLGLASAKPSHSVAMTTFDTVRHARDHRIQASLTRPEVIAWALRTSPFLQSSWKLTACNNYGHVQRHDYPLLLRLLTAHP